MSTHILFVCTGNLCRSPIAEHLFRSMAAGAHLDEVQTSSAGTSPAIWLDLPTEVVAVLNQEGVQIKNHIPRTLDEGIEDGPDLVLTMEERHKKYFEDNHPDYKGRVHILRTYVGMDGDNQNISDPMGQSMDVYKKTCDEIKLCLEKLVVKLHKDK